MFRYFPGAKGLIGCSGNSNDLSCHSARRLGEVEEESEEGGGFEEFYLP